MARPGFFLPFTLLDAHAAVDDELLATWLRLASAAAKAMAGGRFVGAKAWDALRWARACGVRPEAVQAIVAEGMAHWDGNDLTLEHYDHQGEVIWRKQSSGGAAGAAKTNAKRWNGTRSPHPITSPDQDTRSPHPIEGGDQGRRSGEAVAHSTAQHCIAEKAEGREAAAPPDPHLSKPEPKHALDENERRLSRILASHRMTNTPIAIVEWRAYLKAEVQARSLQEAEAFLAWLAGVAQRQGIAVRFAREAGAAAARDWKEHHQDAWRSSQGKRAAS